MIGQIRGLVGVAGAEAVQAMLEGAAKRGDNSLATAIGLITFFLGATGAFLELQTALNAIWRVKPKAADAGLKAMLVQRLISFGLVVGVGFLLLVSLLVSAGLSALNRYVGAMFPAIAVVWQAVNMLVSLGVVTLLFAMIYQFLPDVELRWRDVWVGALVTAGLFTIGKLLIGLYLGTSGVASTYGAAGSVVVLLIWVYYSAQIVLLGAEFTRAYVERFRPKPAAFGACHQGSRARGGRRQESDTEAGVVVCPLAMRPPHQALALRRRVRPIRSSSFRASVSTMIISRCSASGSPPSPRGPGTRSARRSTPPR